MTQVSARLASLSPSATLAMSQKSSELKAQGVDVINLSVGEPDFNTPEPIKDAAKKAIDENYSRYSPVAGYPALRNAIVAKLKNENGAELILLRFVIHATAFGDIRFELSCHFYMVGIFSVINNVFQCTEFAVQTNVPLFAGVYVKANFYIANCGNYIF